MHMRNSARVDASEAAEHFDFDLSCEVVENSYFAAVRSPAGEARERVTLPMEELQRLKAEFLRSLTRPGEVMREAPPAADTALHLGACLFRTFLVGEVLRRFDVSRSKAHAAGVPLRVRIRTSDPALTALPWELLYDHRNQIHLSLSAMSPIVRYIELPEPIAPVSTPKPIRILGVVANPPDQPPLLVREEKQRVENAVQKLIARGVVELEWLRQDTWRALQQKLRGRTWHILHYIGHGTVLEGSGEGALAFTTEDARATQWLRASVLANIASAQRFSLVLLNSCDGARLGAPGAFKSSAALLVQRGVPAVVAMQHKISDRAAIEFARSFYEAAADGLAIEDAVTQARVAVDASSKDATGDWATPVLFMRAADGRLFPSGGEVRVAENDVRSAVPISKAGSRMTVMAVMGTRGGVGKGTVVGCFAQLFAEAGRTVCVIDLDLAHYGTTRDATRRNQGELTRVRSVFDHFAPHASGFEQHPGAKDERLIDVTPEYLVTRNLGRIWLVPATDALVAGAFDVVANIKPPREETIYAVIGEIIDRARREVPEAEVVVIDCGAGKDPTYSAAFAQAGYGYIVGTPDATTVTEVARIRQEHLLRYRQAKTRVFAIVNRVTSEDDKRRTSDCNPIGYIPRDPLLEQDSFRAPVDYDIGYDEVFAHVHQCLRNSIAQRDAHLVPDEIDVRIRPWWNRLIERQAASQVLSSWSFRGLGIISVVGGVFGLLLAAWTVYMAFRGEHVSVPRLVLAVALVSIASLGIFGVRLFMSRRRLLTSMVALVNKPGVDRYLILDQLMADAGRKHLRWLNGISNEQQARVRAERRLAQLPSPDDEEELQQRAGFS
jgi:cellulose biosynthesis protein BcsQ